MESLKSFEWVRDTAGYRLAWMPKRGGKAYWLSRSEEDWSDEYEVERSSPLEISTTQYAGEKRISKAGVYIAGQRQWLNRRNPDDLWCGEVVRPFDSDEVVSLNLLRTGSTLKGWLDFTNKYGLIGHIPILDRWHLFGKEKRTFIAQVEHEGGWHHLRNVLFRIYEYYPAIRDRDSAFLSSFITWFSEDAVHEDRGNKISGTRITPAIAMRGKYRMNAQYFESMSRPDLFVPAAIAISDHVNRYLEKSVSLEISFDPKSLQFKSSFRYGSLGAAIVAEAVEFVAGRFEARACNVCSTWFRIGARHKRKDRIFCSAACKMRDYRARKSAVPNLKVA
jgi:hypothetical protein